ncbi:MAG: PRC-barrel domain-containing protein [Candidatus Nanoarchaeia archaeon]|nr:PRC-barrel domain-containing protein [Candidatus Haiyanarchaeum thermophilum]MCW1303384.1 PRC-barrel domain-containing protein [Candidatus Haiyanarchaeum thermophilum]MCW1303928.1 PRC-barrel domain-containing protein [Candidatus Haiyanarchaeum thermophilum]MCW1306746.1 PRC-barrel domain-containing protein [Candidatus Haiyanarchaeum thermophilum]MCW1307411.1 PRC-barrel domain-containing protein [Candidatus Haiyanarchaeum thermophilum]
MLKLRRATKLYGAKVFTDEGEYFGDVEEILIKDNKVVGWKIKATKDSYLSKAIAGAKGVIVQHSMVRAVGDIIIISKVGIPSVEERREEVAPA